MMPAITPTHLERQIARLDKRIEQIKKLESRFSWLRLAAFLGGAAAIWATYANLPALAARWAILGGALPFGLIVLLQRRLDAWLARFQIWREIRQTQLARLNLDWERIPPPPISSTRNPLDLDLDLSGPRSLHHLLDLAVSQQGSQRLKDWLLEACREPALILERQRIVAELATLPRFRDRLLLHLRVVSAEMLQGERLLGWLHAPCPAARLKALLAIGAIASAINLALFALYAAGVIPPYWVAGFILVFIFYNFNAPLLKELLEAIVRLDQELDRFAILLRCLETYPVGMRPHLLGLLAPFREAAERPSSLMRRVKWVTSGVGLRSNPVLGLALNIVLPWDYLFALLAGGLQARLSRLMPGWLEAWANLEALNSLANFAYLHPQYCLPQIESRERPLLECKKIGHPLIPAHQRVDNDFSLLDSGEVFLITGSNMAGKSTFLKTIGVNLRLAYAGGPVCAAEMKIIPMRMATCMRISDSLVDGWSFFYAEVQCLKGLLAQAQADDPLPLLYLIDELFRGTNNRERLIGSREYLRKLIGQNGVGLIATHDLELAGLADESGQAHNYHFRDQVEQDRLIFDYLIRPGPCPTTNALRIMQIEGIIARPSEPSQNTGE